MSVLVIIALMISYKDSADWRNSTQYVFLYLITFSSCIPFLVTLILFIPEIILARRYLKIYVNNRLLMEFKLNSITENKIKSSRTNRAFKNKLNESDMLKENDIFDFDDLLKPAKEESNNSEELRNSNAKNSEDSRQLRIIEDEFNLLKSNLKSHRIMPRRGAVISKPLYLR